MTPYLNAGDTFSKAHHFLVSIRQISSTSTSQLWIFNIARMTRMWSKVEGCWSPARWLRRSGKMVTWPQSHAGCPMKTVRIWLFLKNFHNPPRRPTLTTTLLFCRGGVTKLLCWGEWGMMIWSFFFEFRVWTLLACFGGKLSDNGKNLGKSGRGLNAFNLQLAFRDVLVLRFVLGLPPGRSKNC